MAAKKSSTGMKKEVAGALSYVLGPITGVIFLIIDKDKYVQFHASQSIVVFVTLFVLQWVLALTGILLILVPLLSLVAFVLWLLLIYKAWMGEEWEVPVLGSWARSLMKKV